MTRSSRMFGAAMLALLPAAAAMAGEPAVKKEREAIRDARRQRVVVHPGEEPEVMFLREGGERGRAFNLLLGRGFLGIQTTELTPDLRRHFGVSEEAGVLVGHVEPDSPADKAGLEVGDILVQVDGEPVESAWDLGRAVRKKKDGETATLEVWRDGRAQTLTATIAERERPALDVRRMVCEPGQECDVEMITDPALLDVSRLVSYEIDPADPYPARFTGHVEVTLRDGRVLEARQGFMRGGVDAPLSRDEVNEKFLANARYGGVRDPEPLLGLCAELLRAADAASRISALAEV